MAAQTRSRIAILAWGSLLWDSDPEFDSVHADWRPDGPTLPIEFSRISRTREDALTLVIDPRHGSPTTVFWCLSTRHELADAVSDLRRREHCATAHIGVTILPLGSVPVRRPEESAIAVWASARQIDCVVWTALDSNFETKTRQPFTIENALRHLRGLSASGRYRAAEYIRRAPPTVRTPLRSAAETELGAG